MVEYDPEEAGRILDEAGWVMGGTGSESGTAKR